MWKPDRARVGTRIADSFADVRRALVVLVMVLLLGACGSSDDSSRPFDPPPDSASAATEDEPASPSTLTSLQAFIENYGYPASATLARLRIPRLGIEGQVGPKVVGDADAVMPDPDGPADIVWYDMSAWAGLGGEPGAGGNAIFGGHVDYNGQVPYAAITYRGLGVFKNLVTLGPGDLIEIEYRGETLSYAVVWSRQVDSVATDWEEIWSSDVGVDSITLFTCGGAFDAASRSYADRIVVRAERI